MTTSTPIYATCDTDGEGCIAMNAEISAFSTREEAENWLRECLGSELDGGTLEIETGRFSDCWIRTLAEPTARSRYLAPFEFDQLYIARPGQHPGGRYFWITPRPDVLIAVARPATGSETA